MRDRREAEKCRRDARAFTSLMDGRWRSGAEHIVTMLILGVLVELGG